MEFLEQNVEKSNQPKNKRIICILTRDLNSYWVEFLINILVKKEEIYEIYMVIDKNPDLTFLEEASPEQSDASSKNVKYLTKTILFSEDNVHVLHSGDTSAKINIVQVSDELCIQSKYYKSSSCTNLKDIVAWDKALYFFTRYKTDYEFIWFLEDDVLFYDLNTIQNIDAKYPFSDILSSFHEINESGNIYNGWNHWCNVVNRITTPWAHSLISASRLYRRLMEKVDEYVRNNNSLMFIEALFSTLALHNNYLVDNPEELASSITYDKKWDIEEMTDINKIYHPLKKIESHKMYRKKMGETHI